VRTKSRELEKKVNASIRVPIQEKKAQEIVPQKPAPKVAVKLVHSELPASAAKSLESKHVSTPKPIPANPASKPSGKQDAAKQSPKVPVVVKLAHASLPAATAKALESKHMAQHRTTGADAKKDVIPEADTLTAVDTEGLKSTEKDDAKKAVDTESKELDAELAKDDSDSVDEAIAKEELGESSNDPSKANTGPKTVVLKLAHKSVPASSSSSKEQTPIAKVSSPVEVTSAKKAASVPPPPPPPAPVLGVPPAPAISSSADDEDSNGTDGDMNTDSQSEDASAENEDSAESDANWEDNAVQHVAEEDKVEKEDEAELDEAEAHTVPTPTKLSTTSDTGADSTDETESDGTDVANEEKDIDNEEAAITGEDSDSSSEPDDDSAESEQV
jgi:hypothetical protein